MERLARGFRIRNVPSVSVQAVLGLLLLAVGLLAERVFAAELNPQTAQAYGAYRDAATSAFLARVRSDGVSASIQDGEVIARPIREDGIIDVPGGLIHHWSATTFLRAVTVREAVAVSQAYSRYPQIYRSVTDSRVLDHDETTNTFHVQMRLKEGQAGITAVLQIRSTVRYVRMSDTQVFALSEADEIRQVEDAGGPDERLLPPERDSGYLWRASVLTSFHEWRNGVVIETETLGLSRRFPYMLGWVLEPIARRLGRKSVETSLVEFIAAVRMKPVPSENQ
jgi:hypothetical protein